MLRSLLIGSAVAFLVTPALAGPCTQRIVELEQAITATQEGAGPALASPSATGSTAQPSPSPVQNQPATSGTQMAGANQMMNVLQEAKQLDQQGRQAECMTVANRLSALLQQQPR